MSRFRLSFSLRIVSAFLAPVQLLTTMPAAVLAAIAEDKAPKATASPNKSAKTADPTAGVKVNRALPKVDRPATLAFSSQPKDEEFANSHVFAEPLIPIGGKFDANENKALATAIVAFAKAANPEQSEALTDFVAQFPESRWRAGLLADLGVIYRSTGYWSKAITAWDQSWKLLAKETSPKAAALGDYVLGELTQMNARLGRFDRLKELFAEIGSRDVRGPATEKVAGARQGLALMQNRPQDAFRCGPMALERILVATNQSYGVNKDILESRSTTQGMSLTQVHDLSRKLGMKYQMAKRLPGAPVIAPSVVNWKVGHFAALTKEQNGKFLSQDPTFTDDVWVTKGALDQEGSGYYLVPAGELPPGWQPVSNEEGQNVWGKGNAGANTRTPPPCVAPMIECDGGCKGQHGMATYNADASSVSLSISDTPVSYSPPKGPAVEFTASYTQREVSPASIPTYSNLGNKWSFNWLSYIVVDPNNDAANAVGYGPGGGTLDYVGFNSNTKKYAPQLETQAVLVKTGTARYEKRFRDGSLQVFSYSDGASVYPRKIFMTQSVDPQGNALTYTYDGSFRLIAVSDALGQITTLSYELGADPLKVTKVTDPFGRTAWLEYNAAGQLWKITDSVGLVSQFTYGTGDFINKMTTPYGDTSFAMSESGSDYRSLEITDPQGAIERIEYNNAENSLPGSDAVVPAGMNVANVWLNLRNTYYWDKKAMAEGAGIYAKAKIYHWLHSSDINVASDVISSTKMPLESRVWNEYATGGQIQAGTSNLPSKVGRLLDDGTTQLYQYEYNGLGKVTKVTDPRGRITAYVYDSNEVDLLEIRQKTGGINELLASYTYNGQHLPLTATDASGQTTTFTYYTAGQIHTIENPKHEVTTYNYDANGYLQNIVGAIPGAITSFTYDGFGRLRTTTDSEGYAVTIDYDAIGGDPTRTLDRVAKITYPDGTYEQVTYDRLDPQWMRDRLGRWSRNFYDSLRHVVATQDPLNRFVIYDWCGCGSLEGLTDANGNTTSWTRDIKGRVTDKFYPDRTSTHYTYENTTSRLKTITDAQGQNTNYAYFVDNDLQQVSYANAVHATPSVNYTYETNYNRLATITDGTGVTNYSYNPITASPTFGAGKLASVDGPLNNDTITYAYDELGRATNRSINGASNASSVQFDSLGRVQLATNPLGTFNYAYVNTTGRVDHVDYPNGQKAQYAYFDNLGDQRLKQIKNIDPSSAVISQFDYTYNPVGNVQTWTQANSSMANPHRYDFAYDAADQLRNAMLTDTSTQASVHQYDYDYDPAGNRKTAQSDGVVTSSTANNLNQLANQSAGGKMHFRGMVNEPATVTVGGNPASVDATGNFDGVANVNVGNNTVPVVATDASGNTRTNNYQVNVPSGVNTTLLYDLNGNIINDGSRTYEWDAANRCVAINSGTHRTEMSYDAQNRESKRVEKENGTVTGTKQFIWGGWQRSEERDANNQVTKRFTAKGDQIGGSAYFYSRDHLGSIRELTDSAGAVHARYDYDPYGVRAKLSGDLDADFGFTGYYVTNQYSDLAFAPLRIYSSNLGRWISRDPLEEAGGVNLYHYVENDPINRTDPLGLFGIGLQGSETTDVGVGPISAGQTGAIGGGAFFDHLGLPTLGTFATWGGFGRFLSHQSSCPAKDSLPGDDSKPKAFGAFGGLGGGLFITNADSVADLSGPFRAYNFNLGWFARGVSIQYAVGANGVWTLSYGGPYGIPTGLGWGGAYSSYLTNTKTSR